MEALKEKKRGIVKWCLICGIPAALYLLYLIFAGRRSLANLAVRYFSRPVRDIIGTVCGIFPFSIMEVIYTAAGVFIIWYLIRTLILAVRGDKKLLTILKRLLCLGLIAAYIFTGYLWLWGIDYKSDSFSDKENFYAPQVETADLYAAAEFFISKANEYADKVSRDENGLFNEDRKDYFAQSLSVYDNLQKVFPTLETTSRRPKPMVYSYIMSLMTFTGIYFPFTGESNINVHAPAAFGPVTVAHELAHQRGVYSEQECNFLGVTASVTSGNDVFCYSGYLSGTLYLMNAIYSADPDLWTELRVQFSPLLEADWEYNSDYWRSFQTKFAETSEKVYDTYLKANGQEMGMRSYGACVDHMVAYYLAGGYN